MISRSRYVLVRLADPGSAEVCIVTSRVAPAGLASGVLLPDGMTCPRCMEAPSGETRTDGDLCPRHALAALDQVRRRLADSRALLESAIRRAQTAAAV
jgi:hypothetical protein